MNGQIVYVKKNFKVELRLEFENKLSRLKQL